MVCDTNGCTFYCTYQNDIIISWKWQPVKIINKRPMGHIAHLRKQFKSINTYDYITTLIKRRKKTIINFMRIYFFFIWRNLNPLHPRMICAEIGWNWLIGYGEEDFLILNVISRFRNYLPFEKSMALHLNKLMSPSHKDA